MAFVSSTDAPRQREAAAASAATEGQPWLPLPPRATARTRALAWELCLC